MSFSASDRRGRGARLSLLRFGVLPGELRRRTALAALLTIEAGVATPGALQVVLHADVESTESIGLQLDHVAVHEGAEPAMIRAERDDVAGLQTMNARDPLDAARNLVGHVAGVVV